MNAYRRTKRGAGNARRRWASPAWSAGATMCSAASIGTRRSTHATSTSASSTRRSSSQRTRRWHRRRSRRCSDNAVCSLTIKSLTSLNKPNITNFKTQTIFLRNLHRYQVRSRSLLGCRCLGCRRRESRCKSDSVMANTERISFL